MGPLQKIIVAQLLKAAPPQERSVLPAAPMSHGISKMSAHVNQGEVVGPKRLGRSLGPAGRTFFGAPISSFRKTVSSPLPRA